MDFGVEEGGEREDWVRWERVEAVVGRAEGNQASGKVGELIGCQGALS